jgi:hypothetical protein
VSGKRRYLSNLRLTESDFKRVQQGVLAALGINLRT